MVSLGDDLLPKFELALESGEIERRVDIGVTKAVVKKDARRK